MTFWTLHAPYRLFRLRRVIAVSTLIVALGLAVPYLFGAPTLPALPVLVICALAFAGLSVWLPASWMEVLPLALIIAVLLALSGPLVWIFETVFGGRWGIGLGIVLVIATIALLICWMGLLLLVCRLDELDADPNVENRAVIDLPPEQVFDMFALKPDHTSGNWTSGPVNEDGQFELRFIVPDADIDLGQDAVVNPNIVQIVSQERPHSQLSKLGELNAEAPLIAACEMRFEPKGRGTLYTNREQHERFSQLARLGFWITDAHADHIRAGLDHHFKRESPAIKLVPQTTLLMALLGGVPEETPPSA
ncbi:hypothetical protein [Litoreibacter roseus]|uniref:Uncharacterized protein n=1 Tax=Litoreibacter roseus TaxID=2601869 RepID=A0A6N6JHX1_9RHOB|nr:hypothetical protein [Litoreibacter roseus]GFE65866.1 hypothetical protein KIN_29400 [Litoreibacter roseus]